jgi:hypothetical protein
MREWMFTLASRGVHNQGCWNRTCHDQRHKKVFSCEKPKEEVAHDGCETTDDSEHRKRCSSDGRGESLHGQNIESTPSTCRNGSEDTREHEHLVAV